MPKYNTLWSTSCTSAIFMIWPWKFFSLSESWAAKKMTTVLKGKLATSPQGHLRCGRLSFTARNDSVMHTQQRCCTWLSTSLTCQMDDYIAFTYYSDVIKYPQLDSKQIKWNSILDVFFKLVCCFSFPWLCKICPHCLHFKVLLPSVSYYWIRIPLILSFCFFFQKPSVSFQPQINSASLLSLVLFCLIQLLS